MVLRGIFSVIQFDRREGYLFRRFNSILLLYRRFNWTEEKRYLFRRFSSILLLYGVLNTLNVLIDTILYVLIGIGGHAWYIVSIVQVVCFLTVINLRSKPILSICRSCFV
jgi:hypothetical protein